MTENRSPQTLKRLSALVAYLKTERADGWPHVIAQAKFWFLALMLGIAGGVAALGFRKGILLLQELFYGTDDMSRVHSIASSLHWAWVLCVPVIGGLTVGIILHRFTNDGRCRTVADVIEGAALNDGRVELKAGFASTFASLITLGTGGSSGREGPVVHLAAVICSWVNDRIGADGVTARDLLGCAVAAGVSASFNAPIAGAIFAMEVVLRHFALHAFGPIVLASVVGAIINHSVFGDISEFVMPNLSALKFYIELPAFFILGILCGCLAAVLMYSVFLVEDIAQGLQTRFGVPRWLRPTVAGLLLGLLAIWFPPIIGVGYETTANALMGRLLLYEAILIAVVKVAAVAITLGGRMGGGIFSPSLMLGALLGLAFGQIATGVFPEVSGGTSLYALAGMGAVAAAVLGAPISTILIIFELTGDWQTALAVMAAVSTSATLGSRLVDRSFFLTQLERKNIHLAAGPQVYVLGMFGVARLMRTLGDEGVASEEACWDLVEKGVYLDVNATLEGAMPVFDRSGSAFIPVVTLVGGEDAPPELQGVLYQVDALKAYNRALAAVSKEEHG